MTNRNTNTIHAPFSKPENQWVSMSAADLYVYLCAVDLDIERNKLAEAQKSLQSLASSLWEM